MKHYDYEISLFVEGELSEDKKEELLSHLSICDKCRRTLHEYENIKNNIGQFYKTLPVPGNEIKYSTSRSKRFSLRPITRRCLIPISAAALVIFLLLFLVRIDLRQSKVNINPAVKKELVASDYDYISTFNRVINKALELREQNTIQVKLWRISSSSEQLEFNEVINSALYSKYND